MVSFGAIGTMLNERGFDMSGCIGKWAIDHPDDLKWLTRQYVDAGCEILASGGSQSGPWKLKNWGLEDQIIEINRGVTKIVKQSIPNGCYVTGTILPSGKLLKPMGDLDPEELFNGFKDEVIGYTEGGVDAMWVMTMMDIEEAVIAVEASKESGLPVIASMAFDLMPQGPYTMMGVDPKTAATRLVEAGADVIGHNCGGVTPESVTTILKQMREVTDKPLIAKPNAGKPELLDGKTLYHTTPGEFATHAADWVDAGAKIVGGCCGSTPGHAAMIKKALDSKSSD
jgi:5-methyltetrahydrofolate--homocysteine methyltransferase